MSDLGQRLAALSREERARLFERLRGGREALGTTAIERRPAGPADPGRVPLSFAQERLWFLDRLAPGDPSYNVPVVVRIVGRLDPAALAAALEALVRRHEALRTTFAETAGGPVQVIAAEERLPLPTVDLAALDAGGQGRELVRLAALEAMLPFDLASGPLVRVLLVRLDEQASALCLTMHHIVSDGWSMGIAVRDIGAFYRAARSRQPAALSALPVQYADFALWQRRVLAGERLEILVDVWRRRLAGAPAVLPLPADRPRPPVKTSAGAGLALAFPPRTAARLSALARRSEGTLFIALLAAWHALLFRYTGCDRIAVGAPVANRARRETAGLIGFFVNTLVLLGDLAGDPTFEQLLARVREVAIEAFAHQGLPFEKLVEELRPERDPSRTPLFQVMCTFHNTPMPALDVDGLRLEPVESGVWSAKLDLALSAAARGDELEGSLTWWTELFDAATVARLGRCFAALVADALDAPQRRISELAILAPEEIAELTAGWSTPALPASGNALIHQRIAAWEAMDPDRPAVRGIDGEISYGDLDRRAADQARRLEALGVGPEVRVAVIAARTAATVVAILGVLKAGGAWVPIDPALPEARREALLAAAGCAVVLTGDRTGAAPSPPAPLPSPTLPIPGRGAGGEGAAPQNAAYVLFTSGSTGAPKGVVVEHRQLSCYVEGALAALDLPPGSSYVLMSTFAADLGHTVLFPALVSGGCLDVVGEACAMDPEAFADHLERRPAACMKIVPSHLAALLTASRPAAVLPRERLILGGEAASADLVQHIRALAPGLAVLNHYGPTETTVGAIAGPIPARLSGPVPLGRPLPGVCVRLLGVSGEVVPAGVVGEVHIGGGGVARGYLGRPDLTAERFVPDPLSAGGRLYRTGDLARLTTGGDLVWLGRADDQVKVRGFRIEPREIEAALDAHPAVARSAVLPRPLAGRAVLAAFVQAAEPIPTAADLKAFLRERLPAPMVPDLVVVLDRLPLSANGKVDRRALLAIPLAPDHPAAEMPASELERRLAEVWADVLARPAVGREENFFDLGGHSLLLARLQRELRERLGISLPLLRFFEFPTVASLAAFLESRDREGRESPQLLPEGSRERASRQRHALTLQRERRRAG